MILTSIPSKFSREDSTPDTRTVLWLFCCQIMMELSNLLSGNSCGIDLIKKFLSIITDAKWNLLSLKRNTWIRKDGLSWNQPFGFWLLTKSNCEIAWCLTFSIYLWMEVLLYKVESRSRVGIWNFIGEDLQFFCQQVHWLKNTKYIIFRNIAMKNQMLQNIRKSISKESTVGNFNTGPNTAIFKFGKLNSASRKSPWEEASHYLYPNEES